MFICFYSLTEKTTYGNGTVCNMGNEMGGLEVSLFADLMYNDLNGIVHTGKIDQSTLSAYLYMWFSVFIVEIVFVATTA